MKRIAAISAVMLAAVLGFGLILLKHARAAEIKSGLPVGATLIEFKPWHLSGADKGTWECPICKYGKNPAVQVWVNGDSEQNVVAIASNLDKSVKLNHSKEFKAFVVYANAEHLPDHPLRDQIAAIATKNKLNNVAMVVLPDFDKNSLQRNEINTDPKIRNTVFVYKDVKIRAKFVNLVADAKGLAALDKAVKQILE